MDVTGSLGDIGLISMRLAVVHARSLSSSLARSARSSPSRSAPHSLAHSSLTPHSAPAHSARSSSTLLLLTPLKPATKLARSLTAGRRSRYSRLVEWCATTTANPRWVHTKRLISGRKILNIEVSRIVVLTQRAGCLGEARAADAADAGHQYGQSRWCSLNSFRHGTSELRAGRPAE